MPTKKIVNCTYCGSSRNIQADHIKAKTKGGKTTTPACSFCNQSKGVKSLLSWLRWIKQNNYYRWNRIKEYHKGKKNSISQLVHKVRDKK